MTPDIVHVLEASNSLIEIGGYVPMAIAWIGAIAFSAIAFSAIVFGVLWCIVVGGSR